MQVRFKHQAKIGNRVYAQDEVADIDETQIDARRLISEGVVLGVAIAPPSPAAPAGDPVGTPIQKAVDPTVQAARKAVKPGE